MDTPCNCASPDVCRCLNSHWRQPQPFQPYQSPTPAFPLHHSQPHFRPSGSSSPSPGPYQLMYPGLGSPYTTPHGSQYPFSGINTVNFPRMDNTPIAIHTPPPGGHQRTRSAALSGGSTAPARKRPRQRASAASNPPVSIAAAVTCGVGPSTPTGTTNEDAATGITGNASVHAAAASTRVDADNSSTSRSNNSNAATDVYFFLRPLKSADPPSTLPTPGSIDDDLATPGLIMHKPSEKIYSHLGCRLCKEWKVYKNTDGVVSSVRAHLEAHHAPIWDPVCERLNLGTKRRHRRRERETEPFSVEGLIQRLIRFAAVNDQAMNLMDCEEFRDVVLFGREDMTDEDLPHRTALTERVINEHRKEYDALVATVQRAYGRISLTGDIWSDPNLRSFMALSLHFMMRDENGSLVLVNRLLAFRIVEGSHKGENLAEIIYSIIKDAGLIPKIGLFTFDNASNNDTTMEFLEKLINNDLTSTMYFDRIGNRIRCFAHIINLAAQAILKELKQNPYSPVVESSSAPESAAEREAYAEALEQDPVGRAREIVAACRVSGQRRADVRNTIISGNKDKSWCIPVLQLLRDCDTRWSSTYLMSDRLITLYPAIHNWLGRPAQTSISHLMFPGLMYQILHDIQAILQRSHAAQQLLSAEQTPTLSFALPAYELLLEAWLEMQKIHPMLKHYIGVGIQVIQNYVNKGRSSRIYALAMILNPTMKMEWITAHWPEFDAKAAETWMIDAMTSYITAERHADARAKPISRAATEPVVRSAAANLGSGFEWMSLQKPQSRTIAFLPSISSTHFESSSTTSSTPTTPSPAVAAPDPAPTEAANDAAESLAVKQDRLAAERQFSVYKSEPLEPSGTQFDLIRYWDNNEVRKSALFKVAMDVLPVQATSVPCERVFSSSKETCTLRRSRLSPALTEALQFLKYVYKQARLDFVSHLHADARDYTIEGNITDYAIEELLATGKIGELEDVLKNISPET